MRQQPNSPPDQDQLPDWLSDPPDSSSSEYGDYPTVWSWRAEWDRRLQDQQRAGRVGERKTRLLFCGCVRRGVWQQLRDPRCRAVVEAAERFADGRATAGELQDASAAAALAGCVAGGGGARSVCCAAWATAWSLLAGPEAVIRYIASLSSGEQFHQRLNELLDRLLTDIAGPATLPTVDPAWLAWGDGTLPRLARAIYQDHAFADLPILADALEDSGCSDPVFLGHLRCPGLHARGCWALDLLLGLK